MHSSTPIRDIIRHYCGAEWSGLSAAHCGACHQTFSAVSSFDLHRRNGECRDPAKAGLVKSKRPGIDWCFPGVNPNALKETAL